MFVVVFVFANNSVCALFFEMGRLMMEKKTVGNSWAHRAGKMEARHLRLESVKSLLKIKYMIVSLLGIRLVFTCANHIRLHWMDKIKRHI